MESRSILIQKLNTYIANNRETMELSESLEHENDKKAWQDNFKTVSRRKNEILNENNLILKELELFFETPLKAGNEQDSEIADALFSFYPLFKVSNAYDYLIVLKISYLLVDFYSKTEEYEKLAISLRQAIVAENQRGHIQHSKPREISNLYDRLLELSPFYAEFTTDYGFKCLFSAWYNYIINYRRQDGRHDLVECFKRYGQFKKYLLENNILERIADFPESCQILESIDRDILLAEEELELLSTEEFELFASHANGLYDVAQEKGVPPFLIQSIVVASKLHLEQINKKYTRREIVYHFIEYFKEKLNNLEMADVDEEEFFSLIRIPEILFNWICGKHIPPNTYAPAEITHLFHEISLLTDKLYFELLPELHGLRNRSMAQWCYHALPYLESNIARRNMIMEYVYKQQLPTYIHSKMVANISIMIYHEVDMVMPQILQEAKDSIGADFEEALYRAALMHDIGKTRIPDIINMWGRAITKEEFEAIKEHPVAGARLLSYCENTEVEQDVARGHHKTYDNLSGYPRDFDLSSSPYRIFIDIVHIADALDAATDHFGRIRENKKTLNNVIAELKIGAGTLYNPDIVDILITSPQLLSRFKTLVEDQRLDTMYKAYKGIL